MRVVSTVGVSKPCIYGLSLIAALSLAPEAGCADGDKVYTRADNKPGARIETAIPGRVVPRGASPTNPIGFQLSDGERAEMEREREAMTRFINEKHYVHGQADADKSQVEKGYKEAVDLFKDGKFAEAKARFTKAIEAYDQPGEKALYKTLVMSSFKHSRNYVGRASCSYELKDYTGAVKDAEQAIKICPDYSQPYIVRAKAYQALKLEEAYLKDLHTASELDTMPKAILADLKSNPGLMTSTSRIFREKIRGMQDKLAARTFVDGKKGAQKSQIGGLMMAGRGFESKGDFKNAQAKFMLALKAANDPAEIALFKDKKILDRQKASAYQHLAYCKLNMGAHADAVGYLTESIKLDPTSRESYINRGKAYAKLGKKKESEADLAKAKSMQPARGPSILNVN